jgi:ubiquinone/menaquinone biosynthesis C-methylase UbiE
LSDLEFTGERVVPGLVDENLFNEHLARYRFAGRYADGARVLDAGCGTGYGTRELTNAISYVGIDISAGALAHARSAFGRPEAHFLLSPCEALPFADGSFDLVLAFEVIEHLDRWQQLLSESKRVLRPGGVLLVSTPNKAWYTASRAAAGPNPWHVHEFDYAEFGAALRDVFPHVHLWTQNHTESIAFVPASCAPGVLDAPPDAAPETAHFFLAACSGSPIADMRAWAWLPASGNTLRERLEHIALLNSELKQKDEWLAELHREMDVARATIAGLQQELDSTHVAYQEKIRGVEAEAAGRLDWVHDLEAQIARGRGEIERLNAESAEMDATISERTEWARSLDRELQQLRAQLESLNSEFAVRAARKLQLLSRRPL